MGKENNEQVTDVVSGGEVLGEVESGKGDGRRRWRLFLSKVIKVGLSDVHKETRDMRGLAMSVGKGIAGREQSLQKPWSFTDLEARPREVK